MAKKTAAKKPAKSSKSGGKAAARPKPRSSDKSAASKPAKSGKAASPAKKAAAKPAARSSKAATTRVATTKAATTTSASKKSAPTKGPAKGAKAAEKPAPKSAAKVAPAAKVNAKAPVKAPEPAPAATDPKSARKGITIVSNKPKRASSKPPRIEIPKTEPLLGPGSPFRKPLIASGPGAARRSLEIDAESLAKIKSPFNKRELQRFREILLKKRSDLVGDVSDLESEALLGRSGSLSALPQHIAEQGSETYEQSLSLNLAAEDRRLIREIDAALQRIDKGTFGICEMTGKPINRERLEELPWTRFSIDAAREMERRIATGQAPPGSLGR